MNRTEEQEFKDMLKELKQQNKPTGYEWFLKDKNNLLEMELEELKKENCLLNADIREKIKEIVYLKQDVEGYLKKEAVNFIRLFKESCQDKEVNEEMQLHVNRFIYRLTHCLFLSKRR